MLLTMFRVEVVCYSSGTISISINMLIPCEIQIHGVVFIRHQFEWGGISEVAFAAIVVIHICVC